LGELLGLTVDRIDFLRRQVRVDRQLVTVGASVDLGPCKTKASVRTVPLPAVVVEALAAHLAAFPPGESGLVFTDSRGEPMRRQRFSELWRATTAHAAVPSSRFHDLRHFYASALIRAGCSVKVVQARLGHATAAETLDTYSHLWPDDEDRTRDALDAVLTGAVSTRVTAVSR
jgi:integrase